VRRRVCMQVALHRQRLGEFIALLGEELWDKACDVVQLWAFVQQIGALRPGANKQKAK